MAVCLAEYYSWSFWRFCWRSMESLVSSNVSLSSLMKSCSLSKRDSFFFVKSLMPSSFIRTSCRSRCYSRCLVSKSLTCLMNSADTSLSRSVTVTLYSSVTYIIYCCTFLILSSNRLMAVTSCYATLRRVLMVSIRSRILAFSFLAKPFTIIISFSRSLILLSCWSSISHFLIFFSSRAIVSWCLKSSWVYVFLVSSIPSKD